MPVELDECLQKLRGSLNQTMRNVIFGDNQNIAQIDQGFYLLRNGLLSNFERFAAEFIGRLTPNQMHAYTSTFTEIVQQERLKLQKVYSPYNLTNNRELQFQSLYETIKLALYDELRPVREAINSDSQSEACWTDGKPVICEMVEAVGVKIDEILKTEARRLQKDVNSITGAIERSARVVQSTYERCADENSQRTVQCVALSVSIGRIYFLHFVIFCLHFR